MRRCWKAAREYRMKNVKARQGAETKAPVSSAPARNDSIQRSPSWVVEMHRYYGAHGNFRTADLRRVLGSPGGFTEGRVITDFANNLASKKK